MRKLTPYILSLLIVVLGFVLSGALTGEPAVFREMIIGGGSGDADGGLDFTSTGEIIGATIADITGPLTITGDTLIIGDLTVEDATGPMLTLDPGAAAGWSAEIVASVSGGAGAHIRIDPLPTTSGDKAQVSYFRTTSASTTSSLKVYVADGSADEQNIWLARGDTNMNIEYGDFFIGSATNDADLRVYGDYHTDGNDFTSAGDLVITPGVSKVSIIGHLDLGVDDVSAALQQIYGNSTGTGGGILIYNGGSVDTETNSWGISGDTSGDLSVEARGGTGGNEKLWIIDTVTRDSAFGVSPDRVIVESDGDLVFEGGAGLPDGGMWAFESAIVVTIGTAAQWEEVGSGITGGLQHLTAFQNAHEITVDYDGRYKINWSVAAFTGTAGNELMAGVTVNNTDNGVAVGSSSTVIKSGASHQTVVAANKAVNLCGSTRADLSAGDVVAICVMNENSTSNITVQHLTMGLTLVNGGS